MSTRKESNVETATSVKINEGKNDSCESEGYHKHVRHNSMDDNNDFSPILSYLITGYISSRILDPLFQSNF